MVRDGVVTEGNCTLQCPDFLRCVDDALATNRTREAGIHCRTIFAGRVCTEREPVSLTRQGAPLHPSRPSCQRRVATMSRAAYR
jgi:hypothetical protein